jgi:hypothetical protein
VLPGDLVTWAALVPPQVPEELNGRLNRAAKYTV